MHHLDEILGTIDSMDSLVAQKYIGMDTSLSK